MYIKKDEELYLFRQYAFTYFHVFKISKCISVVGDKPYAFFLRKNGDGKAITVIIV